ncbi:MAG TPA: hypothetical protein VGO56_15030 [Pyrinomonadaceae bacterium]|jgi:hypothetical protein|nr:hypothetical protein [Pyrinomonadaceae bacterium]
MKQRLMVRGVLGVILFSTVAITAAGQNDESQKVVGQFVVGPYAMLMPPGMFLLIRKGGKIGAIRFTSIEQGGNPGTGKARYESYFQGDGSGSFRSPNVRKKTGKINVKPLRGFHPLAFQTGKTKVKVGEWSFESDAPGSLYMWPYGHSEKDYGYEFAPTSSQSVDEINASDKRLNWFRYSADTKVVLRVSELPK